MAQLNQYMALPGGSSSPPGLFGWKPKHGQGEIGFEVVASLSGNPEPKVTLCDTKCQLLPWCPLWSVSTAWSSVPSRCRCARCAMCAMCAMPSAPALHSTGGDQPKEQTRVCVAGIDVTLKSFCKIIAALSGVTTCLKAELPSVLRRVARSTLGSTAQIFYIPLN